MGSQPGLTRIVAGVSVFAGLLLLVASSVFIDEFRKVLDFCNDAKDILELIIPNLEGCKQPRYFVVGAALGIIVSLIQLGTSALAFLGKSKLWTMAQVFVFVLLFMSFVIPVSQALFDIESSPEIKLPGLSAPLPGWKKGKGLFFLAAALIDMIVTFVIVTLPIFHKLDD